MKKLSSLLFLIAFLFVSAAHAFQVDIAEVCFSPHGGCTDKIVSQIGQAKKEVLVQAYYFTSSPIVQSLLEAKKRGVNVQVILDKSQRTQQYSSATFFNNMGIPVFIDATHAIAHDKVMIIDGDIVITGSFNFTKAADENNAENLLVIRSAELAKLYRDNWYRHKEHSTNF